MSLILDALNRSRQDSEQMPGLSSNHFVNNAVKGPSWTQWLLVAALACAVLAIGWLLYDRLSPAATPGGVSAAGAVPEQQAPLAQVSGPGPTPAAPIQQKSVQAVAVAMPEPERAEARPATTPSAAPATAPQAREPAPTPPAVKVGRAPTDARVSALYQERASAEASRAVKSGQPPPEAAAPAPVEQPTSASREEAAIDIEAVLEQAQAELANARLSEHEVPFLSDLSQQVKDEVPTLMYVQHDYSGDPARSSVVINGKTLRAGGSVARVKVQEILPDSVVLESGGNRFRLRALNSWVNL